MVRAPLIEPHAVTMPPKRPIPITGTVAKKRQTISETVVAETITKTDNVHESAETGDIGPMIGDVISDVDNRSRSVDFDKTQPVFVKSLQTVVA